MKMSNHLPIPSLLMMKCLNNTLLQFPLFNKDLPSWSHTSSSASTASTETYGQQPHQHGQQQQQPQRFAPAPLAAAVPPVHPSSSSSSSSASTAQPSAMPLAGAPQMYQQQQAGAYFAGTTKQPMTWAEQYQHDQRHSGPESSPAKPVHLVTQSQQPQGQKVVLPDGDLGMYC